MFTRTIRAIGGPEILTVARTKNKEVILVSVFDVMGSIIEAKTISFEEDFRDLDLKDGESLEPFGPIKRVTRQGDKLEYSYRRPGGFKIAINRDDLLREYSKPWWYPF